MNPNLINLTDYPIDQPDNERYLSLVNELNHKLSANGLITIENFLTPEGIAPSDSKSMSENHRPTTVNMECRATSKTSRESYRPMV